MNAMEVIGGLVVAVAFLCAFSSWVIATVNMFRTVANRKDGVPLFPNWYESSFNILFRPSQLTDRGLSARRWCFYGVAGFIISCALAIAISELTGVAQ
jgi:hypothetical protein